MDLNGARRKNATRETTSTLKAWLYEHRKNPYPTKGAVFPSLPRPRTLIPTLTLVIYTISSSSRILFTFLAHDLPNFQLVIPFRREDHAGHHHEDDVDASLHLVRQREKKTQEGEQDDLVAQVSLRRDLYRITG